MTEHKFTDEEIMQHMLAYADRKCNLCEVSGVCCDSCIISRIKEGVYLINRQKAEVAYWQDEAANAKKEAVKEFAERLKKYYASLGGETAAAGVEYHVDQIAREVLAREEKEGE